MPQPQSSSSSSLIRGLGMALFIIAFDQLTKWYIFTLLTGSDSGSFWQSERLPAMHFISMTPFLNLVMVWNRGVSFGMFGGLEHSPIIFSAVAVIISIGLIWWLRRVSTLGNALAIGAVMGGAIGNTFDRLRFDAVFDFLDVFIGNYHWPAFNVADSAISIGAIMLIWFTFKEEQELKGKNHA